MQFSTESENRPALSGSWFGELINGSFHIGGWSGDYGSVGDFGGAYDGAFDGDSYEHNNFGSLGWDDK